jgi:molecular chaperone GrpE
VAKLLNELGKWFNIRMENEHKINESDTKAESASDLPVNEENNGQEEAVQEPAPAELEILLLKQQIDELKDKYVRLYADFDNHRKRTAREKLEMIQTASRDVLKDLLPVADDFERALRALEGSGEQSALQGVSLVHHKLMQLLQSKGVKQMEASGADFDVELHEAITEIEAGPDKAGKVIDVVEKGYYLHEKVLRYAKVVVGRKGS